MFKTADQEEQDAIAKRRKFDAIDAEMKKRMAELRNSEIAVDINVRGEINPDVSSNKAAEESLALIEKVTNFLDKEHYSAAETLLRHIYRVTPSQSARIALANARKKCHAAIVMENKWVKRRATLLRRKTDRSIMRAEKKKYITDHRKDINDLLSTAILEIGEGVSRRGGEFFSKMHSMFEVILPPITDSSGMVLARAPLMFSTKSNIDERDFKNVMNSIHSVDPGLKKVERGFYTCKIVPIIGVEKKLDKSKAANKITRLLSDRLNRAVNVVEMTFTHHSSKLFWYVYDFPVQPETMQFADQQVVEDYGGANLPLLGLEGQLSRDEFVKVREAQRLRKVAMLSMQQKSARERFELDNIGLFNEIEVIDGAVSELDEIINSIKLEFGRLTSIDLNEDGNAVHGLAISSYKKLYPHMQKLYAELSPAFANDRDRLHEQLFNDRLKAREYYYEYRDFVMRRTQLLERRVFLMNTVSQFRDIARGTGKKLTNMAVF